MKVNKIVSKAWKTAGASCGKMKKPMRSTRARKRVGFRRSPGTAEEDIGQFLFVSDSIWNMKEVVNMSERVRNNKTHISPDWPSASAHLAGAGATCSPA